MPRAKTPKPEEIDEIEPAGFDPVPTENEPENEPVEAPVEYENQVVEALAFVENDLTRVEALIVKSNKRLAGRILVNCSVGLDGFESTDTYSRFEGIKAVHAAMPEIVLP